MTVIRWKFFARHAGAGLCATCSWGVLRKGFEPDEKEVFCRLITPNMLVPFPVRECTDYADRRIPRPEAHAEERRYGFVTELHLREGESRDSGSQNQP